MDGAGHGSGSWAAPSDPQPRLETPMSITNDVLIDLVAERIKERDRLISEIDLLRRVQQLIARKL